MASPYTHAQMKARQKALGPTGPDGPIDNGNTVDETVLNTPALEDTVAPSDQAELDFQRWYAPRAARLGIDPNPDDPQHFYDYRAAYRAGAEPDSTGHWPSQFKLEDHPRMIVDGVNTKTGERVPTAKQSNIPGAKRKIVLSKLRNSEEGHQAFANQLRTLYELPSTSKLTNQEVIQSAYDVQQGNEPDLSVDDFTHDLHTAYGEKVDETLLKQARKGYPRAKDDNNLIDQLYNEHMQSAEAPPIDNETKVQIVKRHWPKLADTNVNTDKALRAQYKTAQASGKDTGSYDTWLRSMAAPTMWEKTKTVAGALGHGLVQMGKDVGTAGQLALTPTELMLTAEHAAAGDKAAQEKLKSAGKGAINVAAAALSGGVGVGLKALEAATGVAETAPLLAGAAEGMVGGGAQMGGEAAIEGKNLGEIGRQTLYGAGMGVVPGAIAGAVHGHVQKISAAQEQISAAKELAELTAKDEAAKLAGEADLSDLARTPLPEPPPTDPLELATRLSREHGWIAAKQNFAKKFDMDPNDVARLTAPDEPDLMDLAAANSRHGVTIDDVNDLKMAKPEHLPSTPGAVAPSSPAVGPVPVRTVAPTAPETGSAPPPVNPGSAPAIVPEKGFNPVSRVKQFFGDAKTKLKKVESDPDYRDFLVGKGGGQVIGNKKMVTRALGREPMTGEELAGWNEQTRVHPEDIVRAHVYLDDLFSAFESATDRKDIGAAKAINDELNAAMAGYNAATATAGRAVQIQDAFSLVKQQHEITQRLLAEGTPMEKVGAKLKDALEESSAWKRLTKNPAGWLVRRVENAFIQSIFSSPMTHVGNTIGNTLMTAHYMVKRPIVAGLRYMRGDVAGAEAAIDAAFPKLQGIQDGVRRALTAYTEDFPAYKFDERSAGELVTRNRAGIAKLTTTMGEHYAAPIPLRWASPTRLLAGADNFTKAVHRHTALAESAVRQAKAVGLTGEALTAEITRLIDNPTPAMEEIADRFGERLTFQEDPGAVIESLIQFRNAVPGAKLVLPVMKTPSNIARFVVRESPLGVFSPRMRAALGGKLGNSARDEAIASITIGTGISSAVVAQVMNLRAAGKITFGIPKNPKDRATFFASGARPNSILIGGKLWVPYERYLSHIGRYIGIVGGVVEAYEQKDDKKGNLHMWRAMGHVVAGLGDADYLRNMASLSKALSGDDTEWEKLVQQVGGPLGAPSFVKALRDIVDPVSRDPRGVAQAMANRIPGLSVNVPAHMSGDVEQITAENPVLRGMGITESQVPEEVLAEMAASSGTLKEEKIAAYKEAERRARLHRGFDALSPEEQKKRIEKINRQLQKKFKGR